MHAQTHISTSIPAVLTTKPNVISLIQPKMLFHWQQQCLVPQFLSCLLAHPLTRSVDSLESRGCCLGVNVVHCFIHGALGLLVTVQNSEGENTFPFTQVTAATTSTLSLWQSLGTGSCFKVKSPLLCEIFVPDNALVMFIAVQHLSLKELKWYHQKLHFNKSFEFQLFLLSRREQREREGRGYLSPLILYKDSAQEHRSHFLYCYFSQDLVNITGGIQKSEQAKFPPWCPKCAAPELGGKSAKPPRISP